MTTPAALRRVILLGASNLAWGLPSAVASSVNAVGWPVDIRVACGAGRSYGMRSNVLFRGLTSIKDCRLWSDLERAETCPTFALVTDIGNDLIYGVTCNRVIEWVDEILSRLALSEARVVMTELPLCSLKSLSRKKFLFFSKLFYPTRSVPFRALVDRAFDLNSRLQQLASDRGVTLIVPRAEWYGVDPIHIRARAWSQAWSAMVECWRPLNFQGKTQLVHWRAPWRLRAHRPDEEWLFGIRRTSRAPQSRDRNGVTVSFY